MLKKISCKIVQSIRIGDNEDIYQYQSFYDVDKDQFQSNDYIFEKDGFEQRYGERIYFHYYASIDTEGEDKIIVFLHPKQEEQIFSYEFNEKFKNFINKIILKNNLESELIVQKKLVKRKI
jgi:hypothetical protein